MPYRRFITSILCYDSIEVSLDFSISTWVSSCEISLYLIDVYYLNYRRSLLLSNSSTFRLFTDTLSSPVSASILSSRMRSWLSLFLMS